VRAPRVAVYLLMPVEHGEVDAYGIWIVAAGRLFMLPQTFADRTEATRIAKETHQALLHPARRPVTHVATR